MGKIVCTKVNTFVLPLHFLHAPRVLHNRVRTDNRNSFETVFRAIFYILTMRKSIINLGYFMARNKNNNTLKQGRIRKGQSELQLPRGPQKGTPHVFIILF